MFAVREPFLDTDEGVTTRGITFVLVEVIIVFLGDWGL